MTAENRETLQRSRTIVLGIDAMDLLLIEQWAAKGHLPFLAGLMETGPLARLSALSRVLQASLWPSLLTGQHPGQHGLYSFAQLQQGSYDLYRTRADHFDGRFYEQLDAHGVRTAIVDIPIDYPVPDFTGLQVVDWGLEFNYWGFATNPPSLKQEILSRHGVHLFTGDPPTGDSVDSHRRLAAAMGPAMAQKTALIRELLDRPDLDMVVAVYGELHKAGHFLWKYMDPRHPDHDPAANDMHGSLLSLYRRMDAALAEIAAALRPDDNLVVFSDHGMQANYRGEHFMETLLERLHLCPSGQARLGRTADDATPAGRARQKARQLVHNALRKFAPRELTRRLRKRFGAGARVDWSRTQAFILPTDRNSYIRVNLRGREPQGIVEPGGQYLELLARIEQEFRSLVNVDTGKLAVEEVFRPQELYSGPRASELPDISILWRSEAPIHTLESPTLGRLTNRVRERRSGNHRPEGFLLARGPAFRAGPAELRGDILQIAPTLMALHGVHCPESYEMEPLAALLAEAPAMRALQRG